jgi:hypothetical protein
MLAVVSVKKPKAPERTEPVLDIAEGLRDFESPRRCLAEFRHSGPDPYYCRAQRRKQLHLPAGIIDPPGR